MIDVQRLIPFLAEHNLTPRLFLVLDLLYKKEYELIRIFKEVQPVYDTKDKEDVKTTKLIYPSETKELIDKGFIIKVGEGGNADSYKITEKFSKIYLNANQLYEASEEVFNLYPATHDKSMDRHIFRTVYAQKIKHNVDEHLDVMKDLQYAIDNELITLSLESFLKCEQWKDLRKLRIE